MENSKNHILVPVNFSEKSIFGLEMANMLIGKYDGNITVINVIKDSNPIWTSSFTNEEREHFIDKIKQHLNKVAKEYLPNAKEEVKCIVEKGNVCETILEYANNNDITNIVMGTTTANNIKQRIIGTNALRIVAESQLPVITVKNHIHNEKRIERIILPLDLTKSTREKTVDAISLALSFNAEIHVVSEQSTDNEDIKKRLNTQLDQVLNYIKKSNITCTGRIIKVNNKVEGIMEFIEKMQGDLIIITTHQQTNLPDSFMGSFAKNIIRESNIPVMSIVPKISHYSAFTIPGIS